MKIARLNSRKGSMTTGIRSVLEKLYVYGHPIMHNNGEHIEEKDIDQALEELREVIEKEKKEPDPHYGHSMDDTFCVTCMRGLDDAEERKTGNSNYNQAIDKILELFR